MLKFVIVSTVTLAFVGTAVAADLPRPQPVAAPAPVGKYPIGKSPIGKYPVGKYPLAPASALFGGGHWSGGGTNPDIVYAPSKAALDYLPAPACALADRAPHHQALALNEICVLAAIAAAGGSLPPHHTRHFRSWHIAAPDVCDGASGVGESRHRIPGASVGQPTEPCLASDG